MTAATVTAEEVAFEFVATKIALLGVVSGLLSADFAAGPIERWAYDGPLGIDIPDSGPLVDRSNEIELQMLRALASAFAARGDFIASLEPMGKRNA